MENLQQLKELHQKALQATAALTATFPAIDAVAESTFSKEYGYKHVRSLKLAEILSKAMVAGVTVPFYRVLPHSRIQEYLSKHAPGVQQQWEYLAEKFQEFQVENSHELPQTLFLQFPGGKKALSQIKNLINEAFEITVSNQLQDFEQLLSSEMHTWLQQLKLQQRYLIVSDSGENIPRTIFYADSSKTMAYVKPESAALCKAVGSIVASYFGTATLLNRLSAGENPFAVLPNLAVSVQEVIGGAVLRNCLESLNSKIEDIPTSLLMTLNMRYCLGNKNYIAVKLSATYGEGIIVGASVPGDTILLLRSDADPERVFTITDIRDKLMRLAPTISLRTNEISLQKVMNRPELIKSSALGDKPLLSRLYCLGRAAEKMYDHLTEIKVIIKNDMIYPLEVTPIVLLEEPSSSAIEPKGSRCCKVEQLIDQNTQPESKNLLMRLNTMECHEVAISMLKKLEFKTSKKQGCIQACHYALPPQIAAVKSKIACIRIPIQLGVLLPKEIEPLFDTKKIQILRIQTPL